PRGRAPLPGERFTFEAAGRTLRAIADTQGDAFYRGEVAHALAAHARTCGAAMTEADLAGYAPEWVDTISMPFAGHVVHQIPPNGQGIAALMALGMLEQLDAARFPVDSVEGQHL